MPPKATAAESRVGRSARRHTYTGMRTQRIMGSGGITPTVLRSSAAFLVVHGELGALGARFAPRELQCEQPCILQSLVRARLITAIGLDLKPFAQ